MIGTIGLGSNLGDRQANLRSGLSALAESGVAVLAESSVWESEPHDAPPQPWFLNMVARIRTDLPPLELLDLLQGIEQRVGRVRIEPKGPRTLDLDLLTLGSVTSSGPRLVLPHPLMWDRRFVLEPLAEVAPELLNPVTGRTVEEERDRLSDGGAVVRLGSLAPMRGSHI